MEQNLKNYLTKNHVKYKEYAHKAVFTVSESIELKKSISGMHCKCLFLKNESHNFYLVAMPAQKRLEINGLRKNLSAKKLHFASQNELFDKLKLTPGSVSIFGMINNSENNVALIIDKEVWNAEYVGFHPNINTSTLVISHDDLERFYNSLKQNKEVREL